MKTSHSLKTILIAGLASALGACASAPKTRDDATAAKASQAFMESLVLVPGSEPLTTGATCMLPAEAKKPAPGQSTGPSKDWRKLVAHANACAKIKDWRTLETLANAIARMDIDSPWGAYFLSLSAEGSGELGRALWMVDLAQKKAGGASGLFAYQKGRILFLMNETGRAMKEVARALTLDPQLAEGHVFLGDVYRRDMENERAQQSYAAALKIDPRNERALAALTEMNVLPRVPASTQQAATAKSDVKK